MAAIQRALGEKPGQITYNLSTAISGLIFGFTKGWALALCVLGVFPFFGVIVPLFGKVFKNSLVESLNAYTKCAGLAE